MSHRAPNAFSLVELLVVVAVIAVLAALLLPVTSAARGRGRAATCLSNLHQIGVAVQAYAAAHDDAIPGSLLAPAFTEQCKEPSVILCPADERRAPGLSYGLNANVLASTPTLSAIRRPSDTPLAFDCNAEQGAFYSDLAYRHHGHDANVLYADSHVEPQFREQALAFENAVPLPGGRPKRPFSEQNGVITVESDTRASLIAIGAAYIGTTPIRAQYRVNGGAPQLITLNARIGGQTVQAGELHVGDTVTVLSYLSGGQVYESDDGSGHCWTLLHGDAVPSIQGYQGQTAITGFLAPYIDATGHVNIGNNAAIYLFELSSSIDWQHNTGADFQDCVVLIQFQ